MKYQKANSYKLSLYKKHYLTRAFIMQKRIKIIYIYIAKKKKSKNFEFQAARMKENLDYFDFSLTDQEMEVCMMCAFTQE